MVTISLPFPPSVNSIWRKGRGRTFLSPAYKAWQVEADAMFMKQRAEKTIGTPVKGAFEAHLAFSDKKRRKGADLDNRIKVCLDQAQRLGLIENDSLAEKITAAWAPVDGVFIRIHKWVPF